MAIRAIVMLFGFWVALAVMFLVADSLMQRLAIRQKTQEKVHGCLFLGLFFAWWSVIYFWFVY